MTTDKQQPSKDAQQLTPKVASYLEGVSESTVACLVTMVQGNILALGVSHLVIASQTGIVAGLIAGTAVMLAKTKKRWLISLILGFATGIVDFLVHPGMFGSVATEAIVTGIGAAVLSYLVGTLIVFYKAHHKAGITQ
ncbi:MAG: hypothetical protein GKR91_20575 [Pseudomonadales bacterium]|nr:hypothetical protein [Pseudomonadales bacterium]